MKKRFSKNFIISVIFGFCSFVCMFTASAEDTFETIEKAKDTVKGIADTAVQRCDISKAAKKSTATEQEKKAYELLKNLYNIFEDVPHRDSGKLFYVVPNNNTGCETDKYTYSLKALDKRPCHDNMSFDTLSNINSRDSNKRYRQNAQYYCKVSTGTIINTAMIQEIGRASYGEDFERGSYELDDSSTKIGSQRSMQGGGENGTVVVYYKLDQGYQNGKYVKGLMVNRPFRANENENRQMNAMDAQQRKKHLNNVFSKNEISPKKKAEIYCQFLGGFLSFDSLEEHEKYKGKKNVYICKRTTTSWDVFSPSAPACDKGLGSLKSFVENIQKSNTDTTRLGITAKWEPLEKNLTEGKQQYGCVVTFPEDLKLD